MNWTHNEQTASGRQAGRHHHRRPQLPVRSVLASASYAYTWADKGNGLNSSYGSGEDLKDNHLAGVNLASTLAPGLNTYAEVLYENQNFREGSG